MNIDLYKDFDFFALDDDSFSKIIDKYKIYLTTMTKEQKIPTYINRRFNKAFRHALIINQREFTFYINRYPLQNIFEQKKLNILGDAIVKNLRNKFEIIYFSDNGNYIYCKMVL